jgi:hypothetical protein
LDNLRRRWNEPSVEVEQPQKGLQMFDGRRLWKIGDGLHPGGQGADPLGGEVVSQKIHLGEAEQALVGIDH